ncbi:MAG TPA: ABC transporter ATP-binding protein [Myxococcales bacterium]|nr:ABC transporter ATP-binding protein [Myxococcales bacterium]
MIEARSIIKSYQDGERAEVRVLDGLDLAVTDGELVAVVGPSGSGKSTLLHLLGGLDVHYRGEISVNGVRLTGLSDRALSGFRGAHLGFVFQSFHLVPALSALENVMLPSFFASRERAAAPAEARKRAEEVLARVGLEPKRQRSPAQLSGGERQRVAIARALVGRPALLLADEPTGNLDSVAGNRILDLLLELHAGGATIAVITHDREVADRLGRRVFLRDGRIEHDRPAGPETRPPDPGATAPAGPGAGGGARLVPGRAA